MPTWRLLSGSCPSTRTFAPCFLQTPPRGGGPCTSLALHLHQVGRGTLTPRLLSVPSTQRNRFAVEEQRGGGQRRPPMVSTGVRVARGAQGRQAPSLTSQNDRATLSVLTSPAGRGLAINPHKSKRYANPPAGFVQRDFFTHRDSACCLSPARRRDARKSPLHSRTRRPWVPGAPRGWPVASRADPVRARGTS